MVERTTGILIRDRTGGRRIRRNSLRRVARLLQNRICEPDPRKMKPTLRRQIRLWAEANEPTRAVECAVKLWNFINNPSISAIIRGTWVDRGFAAIWERINENEQ